MNPTDSQPHPSIPRARLLMDHGRYAMAADELRLALHADPDDAELLALLAWCLADDPARLGEARRMAVEATRRDPREPTAWFTLSCVEWKRGRLKDAERAARAALEIAPEWPEYLAQVARVLMARGRSLDAVPLLDRALAIQPDHVLALSLRSTALMHLGRRGETAETLEQALRHDPENAYVHGLRGWAGLERRDAPGAAESFREALRLDPADHSHRLGLREALKAERSPVYRRLWRLSYMAPGVRPFLTWIFLGGTAGLGFQVEDLDLPPLALRAAWALLGALAVLTWTASPLLDLSLFRHPLGRTLFPRGEKAGAVAIAAMVAVAAALAAVAVAAGGGTAAWAAFLLALLTLPACAVLRTGLGRPRRAMLAYTALVAALSAVALAAQAQGGLRAALPWVVAVVIAACCAEHLSEWLSERW